MRAMKTSDSSELTFTYPSLQQMFAGGVGGICATTVGHPFDTIKVRLQTAGLEPASSNSTAANFATNRNTKPLSKALNCTKATISNEGFLALYKGASVPFAISMPAWAFCFCGFNIGKKFQVRRRTSSPEEELDVLQSFIAGMVGGLTRQIILVPGERVKCLLQIQQGKKSMNKYQGPVDCLRKIYHTEGFPGFYRGLCAGIARDIPMKGVFFMTYEWLMISTVPEGQSRLDTSPSRVLFAGGVAGIANWLVALPQDTLKSRYITSKPGTYPRGIRDVFIEIVRVEGFRALWKGLTPVILRAFPSNAAVFLGYESAMKFLHLVENKSLFQTVW